MLPLLFIAAGVIVGTGLIAMFWQEIQKKTLAISEKIKEKFNKAVEGVKITAKKIGDRLYQQKRYNYLKEGLGWKEVVVTENIEENKIPKEYRQKIDRITIADEYDMTKDFELVLSH